MATNNGQPDPEAVEHLQKVYGEETSLAIHVVLRMMRVGNLLGNTADYRLYLLTFGRLGLRKDVARFGGN